MVAHIRGAQWAGNTARGSRRNRTAHQRLSTGGAPCRNEGDPLTTQRRFDELGNPLPPPEFRALAEAIVGNIEQVIEGKTATVRLALAVLLAEGHLLIE